MGTANFVDMSMMWGNMPNKYWSQPTFDEATSLSGTAMMESILTGGALLRLCRCLRPW